MAKARLEADKAAEIESTDGITHYFLYFRGKYSPNLLFEAIIFPTELSAIVENSHAKCHLSYKVKHRYNGWQLSFSEPLNRNDIRRSEFSNSLLSTERKCRAGE